MKPVLHVQAATVELGLGELELAGHARQLVATVAPVVVKYVPAAQSVHTALPVAILYLPATQAVHEPAGPVYPALQSGLIQAVLDVLAMGEFLPAGHTTHEALDVFPAPARYPFNSDEAVAKTSFDR